MDISHYMNLPIIWVSLVLLLIVVAFQTVVFARISRRASASGFLTDKEARKARRVGAISAIGPSIAVSVVALGLTPSLGIPVALMRVGMVGSVPYEVGAAQIAAKASGADFGSESVTPTVFATMFFVMAAGGAVWMAVVLMSMRSMGAASAAVRSWKPWVMSVVPAAALVATFSDFAVWQIARGTPAIGALLASAGTMLILLLLKQRFSIVWLGEWALGFSIIAGVAAAGLLS